MKKTIISLLAAVAALALASCAKEPVIDPAAGGKPVPVTFTLDLGNKLTKAAPETTGLDDASGEFQLYAAVFSKSSGELLPASLIGGAGYKPVGSVSDKSASLTLTLSRNQDYRVVFFAMHADAYDVQFADGNLARFSFKRNLKANDASLDAFWATVDVTAASASYNVTMKRPFAQLNVLAKSTDVPQGQEAFSSTMSVVAPVSFDMYAGAAGTETEEIVFASNAIKAEAFGGYKTTHTWVGMNYVLVPENGKVDVTSFQESGMTSAVNIGLVPVKVNGRTNMVGEVYSLTDFHFNVQINPGFGDEQEHTGNGGGGTPPGPGVEDTEITMADGKTYTEESPLTVTAAQSVSVLVNGDDFATVEAGANGAKVTATSSDTAVATAEVKDGAVLITPKSNGTATVTISTPAYTKTDYAAQTFKLPIKVEGMDVPPTPKSNYVKVTSSLSDWSGQYLIVYKDSAAFNGGLETLDAISNTLKITVTDGKIASTDETNAASFTIAPMEGGYSIKAASGKYIGNTKVVSGAPANGLTPSDDPMLNTISFVDGVPVIVSNTTELKFNKASNQLRFRYYKPGNTQQPIALFKLDGNGGGTGNQPVTATLTVSPASLNLTVGASATLTATTNSTATPTFSVDKASVATVDADGKVTAVAAGTATVTVAVAAVEGAFTAASKTVSVTVTAGGGGTGDETKASLTNAEILPATVDASITDAYPSYRDATISSASGTWTANMAKHKDGLKFLQLRNKKGAFITSPVFSSAVSKVVVTMTSENVDLADRTLHAVPPTTTLPTGKGSDGKDITYSESEWANEYGCARTGTDKGAEVTIDFAEGSSVKQFMLIIEGGATYIDHIDVYY